MAHPLDLDSYHLVNSGVRSDQLNTVGALGVSGARLGSFPRWVNRIVLDVLPNVCCSPNIRQVAI